MRSSFQTIVIIAFCAAFVIAIAVFSGIFSKKSAKTSSEPTGVVVVWGILPQEAMQVYADTFNSEGLGYTIQYAQHSADALVADLINALADGAPPDAIIFSSELFSQIKSKLYIIPYQAYSERLYRDTNIDGAQIFLTKGGVAAIPIVVDPLVVYYNKDLLAAQNFITPPSTWEDVSKTARFFTKKDQRNNILQSTIALGEGDNVMHSRDILSALFMQSGNAIVAYDPSTDVTHVTLSDGPSTAQSLPSANALSFYISFSDPTTSVYSWNRSLPQSIDMFVAGRLVFYIGRASELFDIQSKNPNLNFDVVSLFEPQNATRFVTYGSYVAAGVLKNAPNFTAAYAFLSTLSKPDIVDAFSKKFSLPPVRRDLLQVLQENPYISVFFRSALSAYAWPDPNPVTTDRLFRDMITSVSGGKADAETGINNAAQKLQSNIR